MSRELSKGIDVDPELVRLMSIANHDGKSNVKFPSYKKLKCNRRFGKKVCKGTYQVVTITVPHGRNYKAYQCRKCNKIITHLPDNRLI